MDRLQPWDLPRHPLTVRVLTCDRVALDERWRYHLSSPFWRLYCNDRAMAWIDHPAGRHRLRAGQWSLLPPWIAYQAGCDGPTPHRFIHLVIAELGPAWCRQHASAPSELPLSGADLALATQLDDRPAQASNHLLVHAVVHLLLSRFIDQLPAGAQAELNQQLSDRGPLAPARRWLEEHRHDPPSVAEMAERCGYSSDHFARLVRQAEGCSPRQWIERERISLAAERLAHSSASIDQVADDLGYADRYHFSKAFSRVIGAPPARWRREQRAHLGTE